MQYMLKKTVGMLVTLVLISILTFLILFHLPGDPAVLILGLEASPDALEQVRSQLGLNLPVWEQYWHWARGVLGGDFGSSLTFSRGYPVAELIRSGLPVTISLAMAAVVLALLLSIPLGIVCASNRNSRLDSAILSISQIGLSLPAFWVGIILIQIFALRLGWLPPGNMPAWSVNPLGAGVALILPALALALPRAAILTRVVRSAMLEVLGEDYIRTARSKGLSEQLVVYKHALRNALVAISTVAGIHLVQLVAGTVVIEQVFSLPGLGRMVLSAVLLRDLPLVQGLVFVGASLVLLVNFSLDLIYPLLDPRITQVRYD
ncbi:MAG: ABC transporter permease [Firmicutes bacterium]|nr:ABC transporter permease [Bacillota bacterium]